MDRDGPQRHRKIERNALNMSLIQLETSAWLSLYTKAQYAVLLHTAHYLRYVHTHDVSGNSCIPVTDERVADLPSPSHCQKPNYVYMLSM
jgi:hypothetical protein